MIIGMGFSSMTQLQDTETEYLFSYNQNNLLYSSSSGALLGHKLVLLSI